MNLIEGMLVESGPSGTGPDTGVGRGTLCVAFPGASVPLPLCYAAKLWAALWYVGLYTLYWNFVDSYFNLADAKRVFSLLAAGSALGAIIGGLAGGGKGALQWPVRRGTGGRQCAPRRRGLRRGRRKGQRGDSTGPAISALLSDGTGSN